MDSVFILKMLLYLILGMQWLWLVDSNGAVTIALPVGPVLGLFFARHDQFQTDRRLEYVVLLVSGAVSLMVGAGLYWTI